MKLFENFKEETIRRGEDQELNLTIGYPKNFSTSEFHQAIVEFTKAARNGNEAARYNLEEIEKVIKK